MVTGQHLVSSRESKNKAVCFSVIIFPSQISGDFAKGWYSWARYCDGIFAEQTKVHCAVQAMACYLQVRFDAFSRVQVATFCCSHKVSVLEMMDTFWQARGGLSIVHSLHRARGQSAVALAFRLLFCCVKMYVVHSSGLRVACRSMYHLIQTQVNVLVSLCTSPHLISLAHFGLYYPYAFACVAFVVRHS